MEDCIPSKKPKLKCFNILIIFEKYGIIKFNISLLKYRILQKPKEVFIFMRNKKRTRVALSILLVIMLIVVAMPTTAKAKIDSETLVKTPYTGFVNGIERKLIVTKTESNVFRLYFQVGEEEPKLVFADFLDAGVDKYGTIWVIESVEKSILGWNYDLSPNNRWFDTIPDPNDPRGYVHDVDSLDFEGTGSDAVLVGYKTASGEKSPLLTFEELKAIVDPSSTIPEPSYVPILTPEPTSTPTLAPPTSVPPTPTPIVTPTEKPSESATPTATSTSKPMPSPLLAPPTQAPSVSSLPTSASSNSSVVTNPPNVAVQPTATPKVSKKLVIKTSKKKGRTTNSLFEGNKKVIEYTSFKGKLNWKVGKKRGNAKGVKYVGFIKKSKNLYYGDKKGRGYIVSSKNGKRKLIIKKGAKKPIYVGKFVVKVRASKPIDVSNK